MIEWIKITPETEFPKDKQIIFIDIDKKCSVWFYYIYGLSPSDPTCGCCEADFKEINFTHYAIINIPAE